jgi:homoserine O-acetyltransferase
MISTTWAKGRRSEICTLQLSGKHLLAIGITSDAFSHVAVEEISNNWQECRVKASYDEIESENGHDAFIIDVEQLRHAARILGKDWPVDESMRNYIFTLRV